KGSLQVGAFLARLLTAIGTFALLVVAHGLEIGVYFQSHGDTAWELHRLSVVALWGAMAIVSWQPSVGVDGRFHGGVGCIDERGNASFMNCVVDPYATETSGGGGGGSFLGASADMDR